MPPDRVVVPAMATTQSPFRRTFMRMRSRNPASTIPPAVRHMGTWTSTTPHVRESRRQVERSGESARIVWAGLDLLTSRAE